MKGGISRRFWIKYVVCWQDDFEREIEDLVLALQARDEDKMEKNEMEKDGSVDLFTRMWKY